MKATVQSVSTTNFLVTNPIDLSILQSKYKVIHYTLDEGQRNYSNFGDRNFYAKFTNSYKDKFDYPFYYHKFSGLYALCLLNDSPKEWKFKFDDEEIIHHKDISFEQLDLHILLKLLTALYFYNESEQKRRVCQNSFYMVGKKFGSKILACKLELKQENSFHSEFHVKSKSTIFIKGDLNKISPAYLFTNSYYELITKDGLSYMRQLKPSKVKDFTGELFIEKPPFVTERAHLDWYSDVNFKQTRSYLIYNFKDKFKRFLGEYNVLISDKNQQFYKVEKIVDANLPIHLLERINVLDNRLSKSIPILKYLNLFRSLANEALEFKLITEESIVDEKETMLIVQDCDPKDFNDSEPHGILFGKISDPYHEAYKKYKTIPKQTISVNYHDSEKFLSSEAYLDYDFINDETKANFKNKFEVCLNELFLKAIVYGRIDAISTLPLLKDFSELQKLGFIKDKVLISFDNKHLNFTDLSTPIGKENLARLFQPWSEIVKAFKDRVKFHKSAEDIQERIFQSGFIVGKENILEIERLDESVLPEIDEIKKVKADDPKKSAKSRSMISIYSGGIWFNETDQTYIVSSPTSMNWREPRAHHIYKIHQHAGSRSVDTKLIVKLLSVKFVRHKQFTVYPYFFDIIRLYNELNNYETQVVGNS
jgi:hypothetical protein